MSVNDASLIIGLKDEISGGLTKIIGALERYNTATGNSDKSTIKLESSLAKASASLNGVTVSADKTAAGVSRLAGANEAASKSAVKLSLGQERMAAVLAGTQAEFASAAAAVAAYKATLESVGPVAINKAGKPYSPTTGRLVSAANVSAASSATAALPAAETRLAEAGNARLAASTRALAFANDEQAAAAARASAANSTNAKSLREVLSASASTRYALYSVSQSLASVGLGLLALPILSAVVASTYQRDFATVARATLVGGERAKALKANLIALSEQIPISFKDITNIAAAGAQLGINPSGLVEFTRVVSMLTATTNLTADGAEQLLGKFNAIAGLGVKDFGKLASAVLNVGVHSAATEQQIAHIATQIVGIGREAGFTVPQIIGLSGAIASVSSNGAALARGATTRFITQMQKAVASGGSALTTFAKTAGVSTDEVRTAFGTDRFEPLFVKFISGLNGVQEAGGNANAVLAEIGITSVRDVPLLLNLANGHKTLEEAMRRAAEGYANQDILALHYAKINDTLVSKVKELGNTFLATMDSMGGASTGPLYNLASLLQDILQNFGQFAKTADGQSLIAFAAAAMVALGALALLGSGLTKGVAVVIAAEQAYTGITKALGAYKLAQEAANVASATGTRSMGALGIVAVGAAAVIASDVLLQGFINWSRYASGARTSTDDFTHSIKTLNAQKLTKKITQSIDTGPGVLGAGVEKSARQYGGLLDIINSIATINPGMNLAKSFDTSGVSKYRENVGALDDSLTKFATTDGGLGRAQYGFIAFAAAQKKSGISLSDSLNDMPKYREELRQQALVAGVSTDQHSLLKLALGSTGEELLSTAGKAEKYLDAQKKTLDYSKQLQDFTGMNAKAIADYGNAYAKSVDPLVNFNSVVKSVQEGLQANAQAQADQYNATLASGEAQRSASFYYDGAAVSLDQYTAQLQANNGSQQTWLQNLLTVTAQGGAAGEQMAAQFIAAGYSATNASILQQLVDATPEQRDAYIAAQQEAINLSSQAAAQTLLSAGGLMMQGGGEIGAGTAKRMGELLRAGFTPETIMRELNLTFQKNPAQPAANTDDANAKFRALADTWRNYSIPIRADVTVHQNIIGQVVGGYGNGLGVLAPQLRAHGGYIQGAGTGTSDSIPARLSHGEFVMTAAATRRIGAENLYRMMRGQQNARGFANGGYVNSSSAPVGGGFSTLDASALQAIMALADRPIILYTNDRSIAESASRGSAELAYRGTN